MNHLCLNTFSLLTSLVSFPSLLPSSLLPPPLLLPPPFPPSPLPSSLSYLLPLLPSPSPPTPPSSRLSLPPLSRVDSSRCSGLHYVVQVIIHLLNPSRPEFSAAFVGKLIITFVKKVSLDLLPNQHNSVAIPLEMFVEYIRAGLWQIT